MPDFPPPRADSAPADAGLLDRLEHAAQRQDVSVDGGTVAWRRFGDGPPLALLHGGHGSWLHWARNVEPLARDFTVWVADMPGYGDSTTPPETTLDALVDRTARSLDALVGAGVPRALAGFSFGGLMAAHVAARQPAVSRLALLGPAGHGGTRRPRGELRGWRDAHAAGDTAALADAMRHNLRMHMLAGDVDDEALRIHTAACVATRFHSKSISRSTGLQPALRRYAGPLLVVFGEHDVTAVPDVIGAELVAGRDAARVEVVAGAGHWIAYEAPERTNALLASWFTGQPPSAAGR